MRNEKACVFRVRALMLPLFVLTVGLVSLGGAAPVTCSVGETEFLTYPYSDPDPVPALGAKRYPYFRYDGSSARGEMRKWRTVTLENGRIRVVLTPEIGGKVWGATDLRTGEDFVYYNHVVKFRDVATRGPWTSGGIEYNFGIVGHAPSCSTPVDWLVRTNADGSVSCFVSSAEYITRSHWQVEVRLRPEAEEFETHTTWFNASGLPQPYYHWMNAAYSVRGNPTFLFPGSHYIGHEGDLHPWPVDEQGRRQDTFEGNAFGGYRSFHVLPGDGGLFGIWWPKKGMGAYHRSNGCEKYGRKIWLWPLSRAGGIWEDLLTDSDGQYTELQSGRCFQQPHGNSLFTPFDHPRFTPGATETFVEHWGVLRDPKTVETAGGADDRGRPTAQPADLDMNSAYGLFLRGRHCFSDRGNSYAEAEGWYRKSLEKDPCFIPSLTALAALELRRGEYAACHRLCEKALATDAYEEDANYLDGFAYFAEGDDVRARDRLGVAAFGMKNRSAAYALVARTYLRSRENGKAAEFADKSLAANAANFDALLVSLVSRRGTPEARSRAEAVLDSYPLFHAARYESEGLSFVRLVRNELPNQTYLELGSWYEESGLKDDAAKLFALAAQDDLVAAIRLAHLGNDADGLANAVRLPVSGVSPFRRESLPALRWAAAQPQAGWKGHYCLAVLLASFDLEVQSRGHFDAIDEADEPVAFLVRAARRTDGRRLADLRRAQALGDSWRVGSRICDYYASRHDYPGLLAAAKEYIGKYPDSNVIQMAYARALQRNGLNRECLEFLKDVTFLPSELRDNVSGIWQDAQRALGMEITWPENLGSGKPYPEAQTMVTASEPRVSSDGAVDIDFLVTRLVPFVTVSVRADVPGEWFRDKTASRDFKVPEPIDGSFFPTTSTAVVRFRMTNPPCGEQTVHFRFSGGASAERAVKVRGMAKGRDGAPWKMFDRRTGLFVHWGIYAVDGWHEQAQWRRDIPLAEYEKLMKGFTLKDYDPEKWLDLVEAAGMDYVVITAKHHDGFCMWDTDETDYKVTNTPGGRDVIRELADACHRRGIHLGFYYSIPDWHEPHAINFGGDHQLKRPNPGATPDLVRYLDYVKRQVTELLTSYGRIDCFFWDISPKLDIPEMQELVRRLQPGILINPRGFGPGDYSTPERGSDDGCGFARFTEGCDSVDAESWGFRKDADYRSVAYCARSMARLLSKGGNFLLNVGPDADGRIPQEAERILRRLGAVKKAVGEAWENVENVANVVEDESCVVTRRGDVLYLTYANGVDSSGLNLKPFDRLPQKATLLNTGTALSASVVLMPSNFNEKGITRSLHLQGIPADDLAGLPVVIRLEY